jgi:transposase
MKTNYATNLTDAQWRQIAWALPAAAATGRPRKWPFRILCDAMLYLTRAGCAWRLLPADFPPWQRVYWWFERFCREGLWQRLLALLRSLARLMAERKALPSAAIFG